MSDVDLLVRTEDRDRFAAILKSTGYTYSMLQSDRRHDVFLKRTERIIIEVHDILFDAYLSPGNALALNGDFWKRRVPLDGFPGAVFTLAPQDTLFFHIYHSFVHHIYWTYDALYMYIEFLVLTRGYPEVAVPDILDAARRIGLERFFASFLYIVTAKTGRPGPFPWDISPGLEKILDRYIAMESQRPALHGVHARLLVLRGFRASHICRMIVLDVMDVAERMRMRNRRPSRC
jgi:hypothetical protein